MRPLVVLTHDGQQSRTTSAAQPVTSYNNRANHITGENVGEATEEGSDHTRNSSACAGQGSLVLPEVLRCKVGRSWQAQSSQSRAAVSLALSQEAFQR